MSNSEGVDSEHCENLIMRGESAVGRENPEELSNKNIESNSEQIFSDWNNSLNYKIINIDDLKEVESLKHMLVDNPPENLNSTVRMNEAMLWHIRLGHASLNYLKQLQKKEIIL